MAQAQTKIMRKVWTKDADPPVRKFVQAESFEQFIEKGMKFSN